MPSEYSSILLRWKGALREIQRGVKVQDYSAAIVMIEQLIASGAASLVTDDDAFTSRNFLERMLSPGYFGPTGHRVLMV